MLDVEAGADEDDVVEEMIEVELTVEDWAETRDMKPKAARVLKNCILQRVSRVIRQRVCNGCKWLTK